MSVTSEWQDTSPRQSEAPRLKGRRGGPPSSRPSSRALHLDPEFVNTPGGAAAVAHQFLEQSVETFLETEERGGSDSEAGLTPVPARAVPLTPGHLNTEVQNRVQSNFIPIALDHLTVHI